MRALLLNCTLKPSPAESNTEALVRVVMDALASDGIETESVRGVDHDVRPGVEATRTVPTT
jgi:multimeric flavodoxin WrbA